MYRTYTEKRNEARRVFTVTMEYAMSQVENQQLRCSTGKGVSSNISSGGLGIFTTEELREGQMLTLYSTRLEDGPRSGQVKWCHKQAEKLYKVGVVFN